MSPSSPEPPPIDLVALKISEEDRLPAGARIASGFADIPEPLPRLPYGWDQYLMTPISCTCSPPDVRIPPRMQSRRLDLLRVQMGAGIPQQPDVVLQSGVRGQEQRRASGPIAQVHGGAFEEEISQDR